jgi:hypothetical protein
VKVGAESLGKGCVEGRSFNPDAAAADDDDDEEEEETQTMQNQKKPTLEEETNQPSRVAELSDRNQYSRGCFLT